MKIVANDPTAEPAHGLFEAFRAVGGFPIAGSENIDAKGLEGFEDYFALGPCGWPRTLKLVASVERKQAPSLCARSCSIAVLRRA